MDRSIASYHDSVLTIVGDSRAIYKLYCFSFFFSLSLSFRARVLEIATFDDWWICYRDGLRAQSEIKITEWIVETVQRLRWYFCCCIFNPLRPEFRLFRELNSICPEYWIVLNYSNLQPNEWIWQKIVSYFSNDTKGKDTKMISRSFRSRFYKINCTR